MSENNVQLLMKRNGSDFILSNLYAVRNFDISLLPIKFNLPMVSKPLECQPGDHLPKSLSDLAWGYLSSITGDISDPFFPSVKFRWH